MASRNHSYLLNFFPPLSPPALAFRLCAGRVEGLGFSSVLQTLVPTVANDNRDQAIAEFQRAPGYGCLNMGGCLDPGLGLAPVWPEEHGLPLVPASLLRFKGICCRIVVARRRHHWWSCTNLSEISSIVRPPPQIIVRVRQADGTVRRVALDDGSASLDDLRAESGADELFADEACTRLCTAADLVHGAVVYARHNAPEEEGDAMRTRRRARF